MAQVRYRLEGICPLIQHNGRTTDPSDKFSILLKQISGKRKKTEADYEELSRIEWYAGLYTNEEKKIILPAHLLQAVIIAGAKKHRCGNEAKSGCFVEGDAILEFGDNREIDSLWSDREKYVLKSRVKVGQAAVIRTRPIFRNWSANVTVMYNEELANKNAITDWMNAAGQQVGIGDWRPQYGRFKVSIA